MAQTIVITGRVIDNVTRDSVPSPKVQITDKDGNLTRGKHQVMGDSDGNFKIEIPSIIKRGKYLTASYGGEKNTIPLVHNKNDYRIDIGMKSKEEKEVTVTQAKSPKIAECERAGGAWDFGERDASGNISRNPSCIMPPQKKSKMGLGIKILIGLGILAVIGGGIYLATKKKGK